MHDVRSARTLARITQVIRRAIWTTAASFDTKDEDKNDESGEERWVNVSHCNNNTTTCDNWGKFSFHHSKSPEAQCTADVIVNWQLQKQVFAC